VETIAQALCLFCTTLGSPPSPELARSAGDIWYTHETLGRSTHLIRLSTTDRILDGDSARDLRLLTFARNFAGQACGDRFELSAAERSSWPQAGPVYAKQYVFRCR
jgi:hypothetical protein